MAIGEGYSVILIHGLFGTRGDLGNLEKALSDLGFQVIRCGLPGHFSEEELRKMTKEVFLDEFMRDFNDRISKVDKGYFVVGHSFGGTMAMKIAQEKAPKGIVLLSTPSEYPGWQRKIVEVLSFMNIKMYTQKADNIFLDKDAAKEHSSLRYFFGTTLKWFMSIVSDVCSKIGQIACPAMVVYGNRDQVVNNKCSKSIYARLNCVKEIVEVESDHVVLCDKSRDLAIAKIIDFLKRNI